jgi:hypothetical protein
MCNLYGDPMESGVHDAYVKLGQVEGEKKGGYKGGKSQSAHSASRGGQPEVNALIRHNHTKCSCLGNIVPVICAPLSYWDLL